MKLNYIFGSIVLFGLSSTVALSQEFDVSCRAGSDSFEFSWLSETTSVSIWDEKFVLVSSDGDQVRLKMDSEVDKYEMIIRADGSFTEIEDDGPPKTFDEVRCDLNFVQEVKAEDTKLIHLHCVNEAGPRNIIVHKEGEYLINHEGVKSYRNDGSILNLDEKWQKETGNWIFGNPPKESSTYACAHVLMAKNLDYVAMCFEKGNFEKAYELFEKNIRSCIPFINPFE